MNMPDTTHEIKQEAMEQVVVIDRTVEITSVHIIGITSDKKYLIKLGNEWMPIPMKEGDI